VEFAGFGELVITVDRFSVDDLAALLAADALAPFQVNSIEYQAE
jgi:hypothetical protein